MEMEKKVGVVGLGYVGLPVAVAFAECFHVVAYDSNPDRIVDLRKGIDRNMEFQPQVLLEANIDFTDEPSKLHSCEFIIIAVPTPVNRARQPDLTALQKASEIVGSVMNTGTTIVYESTVYPGATEEIAIPILEQASGLKAGVDFFVGYSPERINPGDKEHHFTNITKIVSGQNLQTCEKIADLYGMVVDAGVYRAPSIKVAEAAKVIENTQRDLNIAFVNELAVIFHRLGIDTMEVLKAAGTKWNFLSFTPGLVGGHCIGVDPYYLTYKSECVGYHPQVILAGRRINDSMSSFIATSLVKQMILRNIPVQGSRVAVLGVTFKENVTDIRNSKVIDLIRELEDFGIHVQVSDVLADPVETQKEYGIHLRAWEELEPSHMLVIAVPHERYRRLEWNEISSLLIDGKGIVADIKGILDTFSLPDAIQLWRL